MREQGVLKCMGVQSADSGFSIGMMYDYVKPRVNAYVFNDSGKRFKLNDLLIATNGAIFEEVKL